MKENNLLQKKLAKHKKYSMPMKIMLPILEKKRFRIASCKKIAILTCMDARLDPAKYAGLSEGDAHVIRNAGGRASDDAIRSLVISHKLLGTAEWFVIHHTDCGMTLFTDEIIRVYSLKSTHQ
jgi:carbonic anhydrase